jgi:hypothetical protein
MPDILHRLSIDRAPAQVREKIASTDGLEEWWTGHPVEGNPAVGGKLAFFFGGSDPAAQRRLQTIPWEMPPSPVEASPKLIRGRCTTSGEGGPRDYFIAASYILATYSQLTRWSTKALR